MPGKSTGNRNGERVKAPVEVETPHDETRSSERDESIRLRAYELFLERGQVSGHEVHDWLQAEREIDGKIA